MSIAWREILRSLSCVVMLAMAACSSSGGGGGAAGMGGEGGGGGGGGGGATGVDSGHQVMTLPDGGGNAPDAPPSPDASPLNDSAVVPDALTARDTLPDSTTMPPAACAKPHAAGVTTVNLTSAGRMRSYRLFVPRSYDGKTPLPLVLNLHGSGGDPTSFASWSGLEVIGEREGFIVAGLAGVNANWNVPPNPANPDEVAYARDVIDQISSAACVDATRVYATGFSGGARASSFLGCKLPDRITAIAPVAGVRWPGPCPGRPIPVIAIHGLADMVNVYAGGATARGPGVWEESVEEAVKGWATKNGCTPTRLEEDPPGLVSIFSWSGCQQGATVKLIRLDGVDHTYPKGMPFDAAEELWKFVKPFRIQP
jgi:polyhydroxybutyrate depolymerase